MTISISKGKGFVGPKALVEFYKDKKGERRWRVRAKNGRVLADSGEGYKRKIDAKRGLQATQYALAMDVIIR